MGKGLSTVIELKHRRQNIYVACESLDFVWDEREVTRFDRMWNKGKSIGEIAKDLDRDINEVAILAMDRRIMGKIKLRSGGVLGG